MLTLVCTDFYKGDIDGLDSWLDNLDDWLDYYFKIGIRYVFFIGKVNPSERMIHIPVKNKITDNDIFKEMKKISKKYAIICYLKLHIDEYLHILNPNYIEEGNIDYFNWCPKNGKKSFYIKSYDKKNKICNYKKDKNKKPQANFIKHGVSVQKTKPNINLKLESIKNISNLLLDSSLFTVNMVNGDFNIEKAHDIFKKNGFVIIKDAIDKDVMKKVADISNEKIKEYNDKIIQYYKDGTSFDVNDKCTDISCRPGSRVMIKTPTNKAYTDSKLLANEKLMELLKLNLDGQRIEVGTMAAISSLPNSEYQHWHRDVPIIFPKLQEETQLPAQGLIAVFGVEDVPSIKGPTNFIPCSNILNTQKITIKIDNWEMSGVSSDINGYCVPELKRGDILMFDYRTLHRGGKNNSDDWRTIMYITYVNEWYIDRINFNTKQTKEFDDIDQQSKLLLSRIDHETYIKNLEESCNDNGIPISESTYDHGGRHKLVN